MRYINLMDVPKSNDLVPVDTIAQHENILQVCGFNVHQFVGRADKNNDSFETTDFENERDLVVDRLHDLVLKDSFVDLHIRSVWDIPATDTNTLSATMNYMCASPTRALETIQSLDADASYVCTIGAEDWLQKNAASLLSMDVRSKCLATSLLALDVRKTEKQDDIDELEATIRSNMRDDDVLLTRDNSTLPEMFSRNDMDKKTAPNDEIPADPTDGEMADRASQSFVHRPSSQSPKSSRTETRPPQGPKRVVRPIVSRPSDRMFAHFARSGDHRRRSPQKRPVTPMPIVQMPTPAPESPQDVAKRHDRTERYKHILSNKKPSLPLPEILLDMNTILKTTSEADLSPLDRQEAAIKRKMKPDAWGRFETNIMECCQKGHCDRCKKKAYEQAEQNLKSVPDIVPQSCKERAAEHLRELKRQGKSNSDIQKAQSHIHCNN